MIHHLKILSEYFWDIRSGAKTFDIRKNDKHYQKGDLLVLHEVDSADAYSGQRAYVYVTYILSSTRFLQEGYVVLGIKNEFMNCTTWAKYLKEGDTVDGKTLQLIDGSTYIRDTPLSYHQVFESVKTVTDRNMRHRHVYMTFERIGDAWVYLGLCYSGQSTPAEQLDVAEVGA